MSKLWFYIAIAGTCAASIWAQQLTDDAGTRVGIMIAGWGAYAGILALHMTYRRLELLDEVIAAVLLADDVIVDELGEPPVPESREVRTYFTNEWGERHERHN